jgi:phage shock protein PspC (stress-responsive transcriptional regulator)
MTEESGAGPRRRLSRSNEGRLITGVCAGLARYTRIDAVIFRVGFGLLILAGVGIVLYIGAFLLMATPGGGPSKIERLGRRVFDGDTVLALLGVVLAGGMVLGIIGKWGSGDSLSVVVVFALTLLVARSRGVDLMRLARSMPERVRGRPMSSWTPPSPAPAPGAYRMTDGMVDLARLGATDPVTDSYPTDSHPADSPPADSHPTGSDPSGSHPGDSHPTGSPPAGSHLAGSYATDSYPTGLHPTDSYPAGSYPAGSYPIGSRPPDAPVPPPWAPRPRRRSYLTVLTLAAAAAAAGILYAVAGDRPVFGRIQIILGGALAVVAVGLLVGAWFGRDRRLIIIGAIMSLALASTSIAGDAGVAGRTHRTIWRPAAPAEAEQSHKVFIGEGVIDLTTVPLAPGQRLQVNAQVTLGVLDIRVPRGARVEVDGLAILGDITVDRHVTSGPRARVRRVLEPERQTGGPAPTIALRIRSKVGDMEVTRVPA